MPRKSKKENMHWKKELSEIMKKGCSDSDIEDFIEEHSESELDGKEVWNFVYEWYAPKECRGCEHIQREGMYPCTNCSRRLVVKDHYQKRSTKEKGI